MYLNLGDVAKDDIFEKMSLVASQLPLTREPRKECGARDSVTLAGIEEVIMLGATGGASSSPTKSGNKGEEHTEYHTTKKQ